MFQEMLAAGSGGGGGVDSYECGTFTTQTTDFDVNLQSSKKPKALIILKKTSTYGLFIVYDESLSSSIYRFIYSHSATYFDGWLSQNVGSPAVPDATTRGGLKGVTNGKFTFCGTEGGYAGDYIYWAAY